MDYYQISLDAIGGATIISPSFMHCYEPKQLASQVLLYFGGHLLNVSTLHERKRMWLMDI
ncbi:hypothetical protein GOP47_0023563 [Adiantum capillus-veneris]|uniref:Uncharacterized protein n=1 Tax=Adiantum capillus-veneris TaxID=13818 RepID=A0A9D4Z3H5_ADICA|nr:hypothetical protein GOP47_0023563 [Adiantum capillus-veneris]